MSSYDDWKGSGIVTAVSVLAPPQPDGKPLPRNEWGDLVLYLPQPESLPIYSASRIDRGDYLQIELSSDWHPVVVASMKALRFVHTDDPDRLESEQTLGPDFLPSNDWVAEGKAAIMRRVKEGKVVLVGKIVIRDVKDPVRLAGAYWCWDG